MTDVIRRSFFRTNKFQQPILQLIIFLAIIMIAMMTSCIAFLCYDMASDIYNPEQMVGNVKTTIILSLMILPLILLLGIFWAFSISNRVIGPFERIIRELDAVIDDNKKQHIHTRQGDELAQAVLQRINILIDKMS